jgi:hypothetical protein
VLGHVRVTTQEHKLELRLDLSVGAKHVRKERNVVTVSTEAVVIAGAPLADERWFSGA